MEKNIKEEVFVQDLVREKTGIVIDVNEDKELFNTKFHF
jgi:hypothetical protein